MDKLLIVVVLSAAVCGGRAEKCKVDLKLCLEGLPADGHNGLPTTHAQIKQLCDTYSKGMECVTNWTKECLQEEMRKKAEKTMANTQLFMGMLCSKDGHFRREYMNHTACFGGVSKDWDRCNNRYRNMVIDIKNKYNTISNSQKTTDLCCARFGFNRCIAQASQAKCDLSGALLLRRISETLSREPQCETFDLRRCSGAGDLPSKPLGLLLLAFLLLSIRSSW